MFETAKGHKPCCGDLTYNGTPVYLTHVDELHDEVELVGASRPDNATAPHTASNPATTHVRA